jgi:D-glycero-alpha-D-manno-heptose 1-phosphate guanylyltransferase
MPSNLPITEAIILAGGLGTRLRSALPDLPKCMAPINGKPFISYVINYYQHQGIEQFIFSLGYKHQVIQQYLNEHYPALDKKYVVETEPLGTGGGIRLACAAATQKTVLVLNGDTLFKINLAALAQFQQLQKARCTLSLKPMKKFDRYGVVSVNSQHQIECFQEKKYYDTGLINGGVYALAVDHFVEATTAGSFSFEKDFLESNFTDGRFYGYVENSYFIDIGIPEDYEKAKREL